MSDFLAKLNREQSDNATVVSPYNPVLNFAPMDLPLLRCREGPGVDEALWDCFNHRCNWSKLFSMNRIDY